MNDDVWNALQPALQLLTRLLNSEHPHFRDLMDGNTRQPIPAYQDFRAHNEEDADDGPGELAQTDFLTKFVPKHKIDLSQSYESIRWLASIGFDWEGHVKRIMDDTFTMDIISSRWDPSNTVMMDYQAYGMNYRIGRSATAQNIVCVSAELIWPLLQPGISESEKLSASFIIASVLLHEIAV